MLSLANAFSDEELAAWEERNARIAAAVRTAGYTTEVKIDGAAVSLTYRERPATGRRHARQRRHRRRHHREPARPSPTFRSRSTGKDHPELMEVRGEVYLSFDTFQRLNASGSRTASRSSPTRGTPRPAAFASSIRRSPATAGSGCSRSMWSPSRDAWASTTQDEILELLERWGFQVEPHRRRHADARRGPGAGERAGIGAAHRFRSRPTAW